MVQPNNPAEKRKVTLARIERDHAVSRGMSVKELRQKAKSERKGLDKPFRLRYTVSTIKSIIKRKKDTAMALFNKNKTEQAAKPAKKTSKAWVTWQQVVGVLILAPFAFNGVLAFAKDGYSAYALGAVVVAFGAYLILEKRSK